MPLTNLWTGMVMMWLLGAADEIVLVWLKNRIARVWDGQFSLQCLL
jgi:hypothetical protein